MNKVVELLIKNNKTISTMESCTGGALVNAITNIPGASEVLKFSAVTYSNEYKIKLGVDSKTIDKYTVYSIETADEMSKVISNYTNSNYGVGITGKLSRPDINNPYGEDNLVFILCDNMKKVIIGILGTSEYMKTNDAFYDVYKYSNNYIKKIVENDAVPLLIPLVDDKLIEETLDMCDGLLLPGGRYIKEVNFKVIDYFYQRKKPILGICMGMQTLAM